MKFHLIFLNISDKKTVYSFQNAAQQLLWVPGGADQIHCLFLIIEMFSDF